MQSRTTFLIALLSACLLILSSLWFVFHFKKPEERPVAPLVRKEARFAAFEYKPTAYTARLPAYRITLGELGNLGDLQEISGRPFTDSQRQALENQHFFIAANLDKFYDDDPSAPGGRFDDWTCLYGQIGGPDPPALRQPGHAVFVTSDFLLHLYHRLLEKEFEYLEQRQFYPKLKKISDTLLESSLQGYQAAASPEQKASYSRLIAYFAVPTALLAPASDFAAKELLEDNQADTPEAVRRALENLKDRLPPDSYAAARQELELILAARQTAESPLLGKCQAEEGLSFPEDYTQFNPRSHYRKNPVLRAYFRAMMWYGRMNFLLSSPQLTRDGANITLLLDRAGLLRDWEDLYLTTTFFVGESDDLGPDDYRQALQAAGLKDPGVAISDVQVARLQQVLKSYRKPLIMSSYAFGDQVLELSKEKLQEKTKGFRFMGQRFTPDALIFSSLTQGQEQADPQTGERLPSRPTALMVMTLLGSRAAEPLLTRWVQENAPASRQVLDQRLNRLKEGFSRLSPEAWTQNIYWGWLYTLQSLCREPPDLKGFPGFMQNDGWRRKDLQAALGSWTELKHDSLLYGKQAYAEMGGGEEEQKVPPVPQGYVEPNIEFLDRIIALSTMTRDGLKQRGLLDSEFLRRNDDFLEAAVFFRKIALAQLRNEPIAEADFEKLRLAPGNLRYVVSPLPGEEGTENSARAALVADVFTDMPNREILYEGVGIPNYIFVAVKDTNGARLTRGLVYSWYEFTAPLGERLTDETWRQWTYTDQAKMPAMAEWSKSLLK